MEAWYAVRQASPRKIAGPYGFTILLPHKMRGDVDSRIKLPQDLLVRMGITPDDRKATYSLAKRDPSIKPGRATIVIEEVK